MNSRAWLSGPDRNCQVEVPYAVDRTDPDPMFRSIACFNCGSTSSAIVIIIRVPPRKMTFGGRMAPLSFSHANVDGVGKDSSRSALAFIVLRCTPLVMHAVVVVAEWSAE
jgi:hypothetical protein